MIAQPYELYIERRDDIRNLARYYALSIDPTLFGEVQLTRRWGELALEGSSKIIHSWQRTRESD